LLGGQEVIEKWVLSLDMTPVQFMILAQIIIFLLGWPLEWTEIIIIFMPIFIPLLPHFNIDPLFFGLLVALNLQTAFLSPPVAMAAFYLKGVSPPHVTLNAIFAGMLPFMGIQVIALVLLYVLTSASGCRACTVADQTCRRSTGCNAGRPAVRCPAHNPRALAPPCGASARSFRSSTSGYAVLPSRRRCWCRWCSLSLPARRRSRTTTSRC
jgi:hypothetical protein